MNSLCESNSKEYDLSIVEPSEAMLQEAKLRLNENVNYINASVEELINISIEA